jgi:hypothetical protein
MKPFRDRLAYDAACDEYREGAIRSIMIRPDSLMGMLHELPAELRPDVLAAFARSVAPPALMGWAALSTPHRLLAGPPGR